MDTNAEKQTKELSLKLIFTLLLFIGSLIIFALLAKLVVLDQKDLFDSHAFDLAQEYRSDDLVAAMQFATFFGSNTFLFPAYVLIVGFLLWKKKKRWAIDIGILALTSTGVMHLLKSVFQRPRPDLPLFGTLKTYSFPSGHAVSAFVFASALIYLLWNEKRVPTWAKWFFSIFLLGFAIVVGISRIVLRYHYASDVIGGFAFGFAWAVLSLWVQDKIHDKMESQRRG